MRTPGNLTITEVSDGSSSNSNKKLSSEDQKIWQLCKKYGAEALDARRKFAGLLPEVFKRRIYEKKGFGSIFEFAAKLSGMSQDQVRLVLNLEKRFEDKPLLQKMLVRGEVSINKLARIVTISTPENQEDLASKVKLLSKNALEVFVKDEKFAMRESITSENIDGLLNGVSENINNLSSVLSGHGNGLLKGLFEDESLPGQTQDAVNCANQKLNFQFSEEVVQRLNHLHAQGHDMNELVLQMIEQRKKQIEQTKNEISENIQPAKSRYVPVKIKAIIKQEYGQKCSIRDCNKPAQTLHHKQHFAISRNHDPQFLTPLCSEHHEIAHTMDVKFHQVRKSALELP